MARGYRAGNYRPRLVPPRPTLVTYQQHQQPPSAPFHPPFFNARGAPFRPPVNHHNSIHFTNQSIHAQMFLPIIPRDLILERERERERIRDEIMREEARRKIIEEEVRKEIRMERESRVRNGCPNPNPRKGTCSCNCKEPPVVINIEDSDDESPPESTTEILDGNNGKAVAETQLVEIRRDQFEKAAENRVAKRKKDKGVAQLQLEKNKDQSLKEAESSEPEKQKKQKGPRKIFNCVICQLTLYTDVSWMIHLNGKKHRRKTEASVDKPNFQLEQNKDQHEKEAESSGSKRKLESVSTDTEGVKKSKKQKGPSKEFNCVICQISERTTELGWSTHLNGKKHKRKAEKYFADNPDLKEINSEGNEKEELNLKEKSCEKEEASNIDVQPEKKKILVKGEEIVVKNNRLFCELCGFNCSTNMMMEIHLGSEKHKANSETKITEISRISQVNFLLK